MAKTKNRVCTVLGRHYCACIDRLIKSAQSGNFCKQTLLSTLESEINVSKTNSMILKIFRYTVKVIYNDTQLS